MEDAAHQRAIEVGKRIRTIRESKRPKMTQEKLGEASGMSRTDIVRAESGKRPLGADRLGRVAAALDVSVLELQPEAKIDPLGLILQDRQAALEREVLRLTDDLRRLTRRVRVLERRLPPGSQEAETGAP